LSGISFCAKRRRWQKRGPGRRVRSVLSRSHSYTGFPVISPNRKPTYTAISRYAILPFTALPKHPEFHVVSSLPTLILLIPCTLYKKKKKEKLFSFGKVNVFWGLTVAFSAPLTSKCMCVTDNIGYFLSACQKRGFGPFSFP